MFPDGGHFFIDLAANDWRRIPNSYSLETYDGWSGICIERQRALLAGTSPETL